MNPLNMKLPSSPEMNVLLGGDQQQYQHQQQYQYNPDGYFYHQQQSLVSSTGITLSNVVPAYNATINDTTRRLLSIAKYESFDPQNLACSQPIIDDTSYNNNPNGCTIDMNHNNSCNSQTSTKIVSNLDHLQQKQPPPPQAESLGAVAGSHGVALFRVSRPHAPLMILSSYTTTIANTNTKRTSSNHPAITSLCFQPIASTSASKQRQQQPSSIHNLYLASARGSGVLVWDVSGHSLSPLWGRLRIDTANTPNKNYQNDMRTNRITSLTWKTSTSALTSSQECCVLAATTSSSACFWDIRHGSSSSSIFKPSLRFAMTTTAAPPYVQIACSPKDNECAIIDSSGIVRIYDIRMAATSPPRTTAATTKSVHSNTTTNNDCLYTFTAFQHIGVGLSYLPTTSDNDDAHNVSNSSNNNCWITWGYDSSKTNDNNAIVKLWMINKNNDITTTASNDDGTSSSVIVTANSNAASGSFDDTNSLLSSPPTNRGFQSTDLTYRMIGQCNGGGAATSSSFEGKLACARVCPSPIEDSFITISFSTNRNNNNSNSTSNDSETFNSWHAELWKLNLSSSSRRGQLQAKSYDEDDGHNDMDDDDGQSANMLQKIVAFNGINDFDTNKTGRMGVSSNNNLVSIFGKNHRLGSLCAAEVALSSYGRSIPYHYRPTSRSDTNNNNNVLDDNDGPGGGAGTIIKCCDYGLVLCCLSESGFVTTHAIPEAIAEPKTRKPGSRRNLSIKNDNDPVTGTNISSSQNQMKLFPSERDCAVSDAARIWSNNNNSKAVIGTELGSVRQSSNASVLGPVPEARTEQQEVLDSESTLPIMYDVGGSGGPMQFDMDVIVPMGYGVSNAVAPGITGINDIGSSNNPFGNTGGVIISDVVEGQQVAAEKHMRDAAALMENIETDRIPCPRLCGATFSPGAGGLAAFHNGDVGKMWNWWEKTDPTRISSVPGMIGEPSLNETKGISNAERGPTQQHFSNRPDAISKAQNCPRTLKELSAMIAAAKVAQWGEEESEASSAGFRGVGDNFFDDDSSSSNSVGDGPEDGFDAGSVTRKKQNSMTMSSSSIFESFFGGGAVSGGHRRQASNPSPAIPQSCDSSDARSGNVTEIRGGPELDALTPLVKVSHQYDRLALNNQSKELAKGWVLGDMNNQDITMLPDDSNYIRRESSESVLNSANHLTDIGVSLFSDDKRLPSQYRSLLLPTPRVTSPDRAHSDSDIVKHSSSSGNLVNRNASKTFADIQDEKGVHGGEYSVRPNKQESMVFLRKLFTHQQLQDERPDSSAFQSHITPPDRPMLPKPGSPRRRKCDTQSHPPGKEYYKKGEQTMTQAGVYAILIEEKENARPRRNLLLRTYDACLHNAEVCHALGEYEKKEVWELLAHAVQGQSEPTNAHVYDGWGGALGGGALGFGLVDSLLRFYESLGDVQMLSTIVCVLRVGPSLRRQKTTYTDTRSNEHTLESLLLSDDDERYDMYIRRYADLLYAWDLLTIRAELCKHLVRIVVPSDEIRMLGHVSASGDGAVAENTNPPGIALVFKCPRCGGDTDFGTNFCRSCQDYAFRCSICDDSVRGLFTVCGLCGHGGHVDHLKFWFMNHKVCPTGCGCQCKINIIASAPTETAMSVARLPEAATLS